jgi:hypothetical protein
MSTPRSAPAVTLTDGRVLFSGGLGNQSALSIVEIYDPATNTWSTAPSLTIPRGIHTATLLANGEIVVAGGISAVNASAVALASAEVSQPGAASGAACALATDCGSGLCVDGVCCATACAGGATDCQACSVAAGAAQNGICGPTTGNACNDGDACTRTDTCQSGVCSGSNPVTCAPLDACHSAGTCSPSTGVCSNPTNNNPACGMVCITLQRGLAGSVADALINEVGADKNFGASGALTASVGSPGQRHGLLRFDLSAIPPGATITSATATLGVLLHGGAPVHAHRVTAPWSESSVTWSSFAGAYSPVVEATFPAVNTTTADLTALVQQWTSGAVANDGILLERGVDGTTVFGSCEAAPALRPSLQICYLP